MPPSGAVPSSPPTLRPLPVSRREGNPGRAGPGRCAARSPALLPRTLPGRADRRLPTIPGGAIGYIAYDFGRSLEPAAIPERRAGLCDDIALNLYDTLVAIDHGPGAAHSSRRVSRRRNRRPEKPVRWHASTPSRRYSSRRTAAAPAAGHAPRLDLEFFASGLRGGGGAGAATTSCAGDIFQANLAAAVRRPRLPPGFDAFDLYRRLRAANPAPFAACLAFGGLRDRLGLARALPELAGRRVETRPIKGTGRAVADPDEDARARRRGAAGRARRTAPRTS